MIKSDLRFEFEIRSSDFIELSQKGLLETASIKITVDKTSVIDCLMAGCISHNSKMKAQLISDDRRSLKQRRSYLLEEFDFDSTISLRLFAEQDVVQILFVDEPNEYFVQIKCAELPLSLVSWVPWYVQIGSKQILV
jgi:hypothetical protein